MAASIKAATVCVQCWNQRVLVLPLAATMLEPTQRRAATANRLRQVMEPAISGAATGLSDARNSTTANCNWRQCCYKRWGAQLQGTRRNATSDEGVRRAMMATGGDAGTRTRWCCNPGMEDTSSCKGMQMDGFLFYRLSGAASAAAAHHHAGLQPYNKERMKDPHPQRCHRHPQTIQDDPSPWTPRLWQNHPFASTCWKATKNLRIEIMKEVIRCFEFDCSSFAGLSPASVVARW
ncbi:hypothetical protein VPH35_039738 [Triticum aestivum]|uniref:Uncharacterized protein n=1 Tax=Aegilops tauschii TaxID=37682 RepID=R7W4J8_AEGTA